MESNFWITCKCNLPDTIKRRNLESNHMIYSDIYTVLITTNNYMSLKLLVGVLEEVEQEMKEKGLMKFPGKF